MGMLNATDRDPTPHPEPMGQEETYPSLPSPPPPSWLLGWNIATLVAGIVAGLPEELAPSSKYQLATQLTQTLLQTQVASTLVPPGGQQ